MARTAPTWLFHPMRDPFSLEVWKSERLRIRILMAVFGAASLGQLAYLFVPASRDPFVRQLGIHLPVETLLPVLAAATLYELGFYLVVSYWIRHRIEPPSPARWGNALIETSLPTFITAVAASRFGLPFALSTPLPAIYFLFIILSILRLNPWLTLFTGAVAALGLYGVALACGTGDPWPPSPLALGRSVTLLVAGLVAAFVAEVLRRNLRTVLSGQEERTRITGMFGQYLSPEVVDRLLAQKTEIRPEVGNVAVLFLDIRDFTRFSETRKPEEVIAYLNDLFAGLIEIVNRHQGMVNKFLGDGFLAVFGALERSPKDGRNAVLASLEMIRHVEELSAKPGFPPTRIGIGIHAGPAVTGNVGSEGKKEFAILGDTVNLASRVEQLNKTYGSTLLVTDSVRSGSEDLIRGEPLPPVQVKGRAEPVCLYRVC